MENAYKTTNGRSLSKTIQTIIRESIKGNLAKNAQDEQERQKQFLDEEDDESMTSDEEKSFKATSSKTMDDEKEKLKKGDIEVDDVIEKLNSIRSGKSFNDVAVKGKLSEYVKSLSKAEKIALFAFLKGIAQLVTGEIEPEAALDPSDKPAGIEMKKDKGSQKKTVKPNVIKAPSLPEKVKRAPAVEDTTGPVPIKPKK